MHTIRVFVETVPTNIIVGDERDLSITVNHLETQKIRFKVYSVDGCAFLPKQFGCDTFDYWVIDSHG
jgi:hypothetical protein